MEIKVELLEICRDCISDLKKDKEEFGDAWTLSDELSCKFWLEGYGLKKKDFDTAMEYLAFNSFKV